MSAEDDEDAAEYASELLVGLVAEHLGGQDVDASVLTEGLLLRRELVEEWVGGGTPLYGAPYSREWLDLSVISADET